jgi:hypothetical protein
VDQEAVVAKQERVQEILAQFAPKDQFNLDETALLPFAVPTVGWQPLTSVGRRLTNFRSHLPFSAMLMDHRSF